MEREARDRDRVVAAAARGAGAAFRRSFVFLPPRTVVLVVGRVFPRALPGGERLEERDVTRDRGLGERVDLRRGGDGRAEREPGEDERRDAHC